MTLYPQFWWWVARSTGIVAWATATAAMAWGLVLSGRLVRRRRLPSWLLDLHRYLGTLTVAFVAVHLVALVADGWTDFGLADLFVPMASEWRPGAVTWGVIALYGLVVIQVTSWGMRFLSRPVWHTIHLSSFVVFITATVHGALSGADRDNPFARILLVAGVTIVLMLTVMRLLEQAPETKTAGSRAEQLAAARAALATRPAAGTDDTPTPDTDDTPPPTTADADDDTAPAAVVPSPTTADEWAALAAEWAAAASEPVPGSPVARSAPR